MTLPPEKVAELATFYESGATIERTAEETGVPATTVWRHFRRFYARKLPRKPLALRTRICRYEDGLPPAYLGPTLIGKASTEAPERAGPDWIGEAIVTPRQGNCNA